MADRLEHGEALPDEFLSVSFIAAWAGGLPPALLVFFPLFFALAGRSNERPGLTECWHGADGLMLCSPFTIAMKSDPRCLRVWQRPQGSLLKISRQVGK